MSLFAIFETKQLLKRLQILKALNQINNLIFYVLNTDHVKVEGNMALEPF